MSQLVEYLVFVPRGVFAVYLGAGLLALSYALMHSCFPRATGSERWFVTGLLMIALGQLAFHLLLALHLFSLFPALVLNTLGCVVSFRLDRNWRSLRAAIHRDLRGCLRTLRALLSGSRYVVAYAVLGLVLLTALRLLFLPILSYDSLTYHGLKAALWVQGGGPITYTAPGSWGIYKSYFGGGEVGTAWAMLPFHADTLATAYDLFPFSVLMLGIYSLGRMLGLRARNRWIAVVYVGNLPALRLSMGSAYVDPTVSLAIIGVLCFLILYTRHQRSEDLILACIAAGVACATKLNAWSMLAPPIMVMGCYVAFHYRTFLRHVRPFLIGAACMGMLVGPWLVYNTLETGFPLGSVPLKIAGIELGRATPELDHYLHSPSIKPYDLHSELQALKYVYFKPGSKCQHLSLWTLPALGIALAGLASRRIGRWESALIVGLCLGSIYAVYQPAFSSVRLIDSPTLGRFFFPMTCLLILCALVTLQSRQSERAFGDYLLAGSMLHLYYGIFSGWSALELLLLLPLFGLLFLATVERFWRPRPLICIILVLLFFPVVQAARDRLYLRLSHDSYVLNPVKKDWFPAIKLLAADNTPRRIAHTAGIGPRGLNWFSYPFVGSRLRHEVHYVPISSTGQIIPRTQAESQAATFDFARWLDSLRERKIDRVISFSPASTELGWMEEHSDQFTLVAGDRETWGFYAVKTAQP
ncbi:MAG: hypothetical protein ACI9QL_003704 [Candidatus Omnitrophota bacterium]|jgi:hypothetical protein